MNIIDKYKTMSLMIEGCSVVFTEGEYEYRYQFLEKGDQYITLGDYEELGEFKVAEKDCFLCVKEYREEVLYRLLNEYEMLNILVGYPAPFEEIKEEGEPQVIITE